MAVSIDELVDENIWEGLPDLLRVQAGWYPGNEVLDLHSPHGRVALDFAQDAPEWTIYTEHTLEKAPENLEHVDLDLEKGKLPFEDDQLAAVVGTMLDHPFKHLDAGLAREILRVLAPGGPLILFFRGPGPRASHVERTLPRDAVTLLGDAGFEHPMETRVMVLRDGSEIRRLRAVKPERA